jgi:hypothetical protein
MNWIAIRIFEKLGWAEKIRLYDTEKTVDDLKRAALAN